MTDEKMSYLMAPDQITAEFWIQVLQDEGITAMIRPSDAVSFLGVSGFGCRVQVREADLDRANEIVEGLKGEA
jgi:hypothetical protein